MQFLIDKHIIALCTSMAIIYLLSRKVSNKVLLCISVPIYLLYCLFSNYYGLLSNFTFWNVFCDGYRSFFVTLCNNFPAAFLWLTLGKMFAEGKIEFPYKYMWWMLLGAIMTLYLEQIIVLHYQMSDKTDYYLSLVPCCLALFSILRRMKIHCSTAFLLRKTSTVMYVLHSSAISVFNLIGNKILYVPQNMMPVFLTISAAGTCIVVTFIISRLEKKRGFHWLKYAY